jgi:hypothetical protein
MVQVRGDRSTSVVTVMCALAGALASMPAVARAQQPGKPEPLIGATEVTRITPPAGFIDDVVAFDDQRLVYVIADAATKAEAHVVTLATGADAVVDLAAVTLHPTALALLGPRLLVIGTADDNSQTAALVEIAATGKLPPGKIIYRVSPATHITVVPRDGKPRLVVDRVTPAGDGTSHQVELLAIDTGRRLAIGHALELDASGTHKKLGLHVNHWADGGSHAIGIRAGSYNPKSDQRSPDDEATYDLVTNKFVEHADITDLFEQRKRYQALAEAGGTLDFVRIAWDNASLQVWHAGKPHALELDQPLAAYDLKSLTAVVTADGGAWLALKIDPVNAEAVARKKADVEYLDIFRAGPDGKAVRKARVLATGVRHRFGAFGDRFWLIERNNGFDRGGRALVVYQPT